MASLPWISAIFRPGLPSLSRCTDDSSAASSCRMAPTSNSLWAQEAEAARLWGKCLGVGGRGGRRRRPWVEQGALRFATPPLGVPSR